MPKHVAAAPGDLVAEPGLADGPYAPALAEAVSTPGLERHRAVPHEPAWWEGELERLELRAELAAHELL